MSTTIYNIFLLLFRLGVRVSSLWNVKAGKWLQGRKNIFEKLKAEFSSGHHSIAWFHCSSLGEFEQGRPVLEKLKELFPNVRILLTFFSPSGYEIRKNYQGADWIYYLPLDSKINARMFFDLVNPTLVVFVKYEFWYYYFMEAKRRQIPLLMISALFRPDQPFFKWYGRLHRKMLDAVNHFFVQNEESKKLLETLSVQHVSIAGDSRFDRVIQIAEEFIPIPEIERFCNHEKTIVCGSTWSSDENIIKEVFNSVPGIKWILAPHEIDKKHLQNLRDLFPDSIFYSELKETLETEYTNRVLIIDNIGMLSRLYKYADITYVGGGFDSGIHNVLEAAVYNKPVIFGPRYRKFNEATDLVKIKAGFSVQDADELKHKIISLLSNENGCYLNAQFEAGKYMQQMKGATDQILDYIQENRLLTRE